MSTKELLGQAIGRKIASAPETPHHKRARKSWNSVLGDAAVREKNWRMIAGVLGGALVLSSGASWHYAHLPSPPPLIAERCDATGVTQVIGYAGTANAKVNVQDYRTALSRWIQNVRSLSSDPVVVKDKWAEAYAFMGPQAQAKLNQEANADDSPQKKIGQVTIAVQVGNVVPISPDSYEGRWVQTTYNMQNGAIVDRSDWTATFTVMQREMKSDDPQALINPNGLTIVDFSWHKDLSNRN
ncbi:VirB8/TrbF family protein (plasmid) [Dyella sp. BiH032]|uniref:VirB8/TrbF family protein n=1 Tax=Dyella sp. BiH032 TaxID=3075430 RepID=UPI0028930ED6|nr:VirB8/TrbF family protein [Dyella sp. BiH032]WNL48563.1 VirB8/TrbF family protein [Dyella sp. BiH032]